jgi:hypothetical protein
VNGGSRLADGYMMNLKFTLNLHSLAQAEFLTALLAVSLFARSAIGHPPSANA